MRGSIQKKGEMYYAVLPLGSRRKWFKGGTTRKEAEKVLIEKSYEFTTGAYREIPKISFKKFADLWLENYAAVNVKPSTLSVYKHIIEKRFLHAFGGMNMTDITLPLLQSYVSKRRNDGLAKIRRNIGGDRQC